MRSHVWIGLAVVGLLATLGRAQAATGGAPAAAIDPPRIPLDGAALLRVEGEAAPPPVDGLRFQRAGQTTEMSSMNGKVSQRAYVLYRVTAARPGTYLIPLAGRTVRLEVDPAGPTGGAGTMATARPAAAGGRDPALAFLRVGLPGRRLYVGQSAPVTFKAYFRPGTEVTLTAPPSLGATAFTVSQLSDPPRQSVETVGGVPYRVATWTGRIAAAMPGRFAARPTLPIVARWREASRAPARDPFAGMGDPFGGMLDDDDAFPSSSLLRSFMQRDPFGGLGDLFGEVREQEMTLRAPEQSIDVRPLPAAGRPPGFGGAVGHFDVQAALAPAKGTAFEPMTLTLRITGQGNFDRVATGGLPPSADWKSYPPTGKPAADGEVFEQAVVPQRSGAVVLPGLRFSFFDPDRQRYVTRTTAPITVEVAAAPGPIAPARAPDASAPPGGVDRLRPNRRAPGRFVRTLLPPWRRAWFWPLATLPFLALAVGLGAGRDRRPSARRRRRALRAAIARDRATMRRAALGRDPARFFDAARGALQARLGERWGIAAEEVTAAEAQRRLGEDAAPIVDALHAAEHLRYAGVIPDAGGLLELDAVLERELDRWEGQP